MINVIDAEGDDAEDDGQHPPQGDPSEAQHQSQEAAQQEPQNLEHYMFDAYKHQHHSSGLLPLLIGDPMALRDPTDPL